MTWPLEALRSVLRSAVTRLFVDAYALRMRGGTLRWQS